MSLPLFWVSPESVRTGFDLTDKPQHTDLIDGHSGPNREIKKAVESYWAFKTSAEDLQAVAKDTKQKRWESIKAKGVDSIPA